MGKYSCVVVEQKAQRNCRVFIKSGNTAEHQKTKTPELFDELEETIPKQAFGQPEQLKINLSGHWSRKINQKDRLIYRIEETIVTVFVI